MFIMIFMEIDIRHRTMNVILNDLHLNYQGHILQVAILTSIDWKMQTLLLPSDKKSGIWLQIVPLRMLYIMTEFFQVRNFQM